MKMNRILISLVMLLCANVLLGQRKEPIPLLYDDVKDMPQKIIKAYFKPVYSSTGVYYPFMQWYAYENQVDIWDKKALTKLNASIYEFNDDPTKAVVFALLFCRSFGVNDFIYNFEAIGFTEKEINIVLQCYKIWQESEDRKK